MTDIAERPTRSTQRATKASGLTTTAAKLAIPATSSKLTTRQLASLRSQLEGDRERTGMLIDTITDEMGAIVTARRDTATDDEHDPEGPTLAFERSQSSAILGQSQQHLAEIDAAIARMDAGRYGLCKSCGNEIALGRLQVRPQAALCISCAARVR
jgi:DnaK suppressor protein